MLLWCEISSLIRGNTMWSCKQATRVLLTVNVIWLSIWVPALISFKWWAVTRNWKQMKHFSFLELLLDRVFVTATEMRQEQTVKYNNSENLALPSCYCLLNCICLPPKPWDFGWLLRLLSFYMGVKDPVTGLHTCEASALSTKSSPQPSLHFFPTMTK